MGVLDTLENAFVPAPAKREYDKTRLVHEARQVARKYRIPEDVFVRQIYAESGFGNPGDNSAGAAGIAQFLRGTAAKYGLSASDRMNPSKALDASARMFRDNMKTYNGDLSKVLGAYIAGTPGKGGKDERDYIGRILHGRNPDGSKWELPAWLGKSDAVGNIGNKGLDAIGDAVQPIDDATSAVAGGLAPIAHFFANLVEPAFWLRVGKVLLGLLLLVYALRRLA